VRKVGTVILALLAVFAVVLTVGGLAVYRAALHEPAFYQRALEAQPETQARAGDALEKRLLDLRNDARSEGRWQALFTEEQLNGWLASDLPEKFPSLLPAGTEDPRVDLVPQCAQVACRFEQGKFSSVISFVLNIALTEETNQLAVRISKVRAGALPVPLKRFLDRIAAAAQNADIDLRWKQSEGDPVALITVPARHEDYAHGEIYLEAIELRDGELFLAGRTEKPTEKLLARHGAVYQGSAKQTVQR
jgi:hypothetical protein